MYCLASSVTSLKTWETYSKITRRPSFFTSKGQCLFWGSSKSSHPVIASFLFPVNRCHLPWPLLTFVLLVSASLCICNPLRALSVLMSIHPWNDLSKYMLQNLWTPWLAQWSRWQGPLCNKLVKKCFSLWWSVKPGWRNQHLGGGGGSGSVSRQGFSV